MATLRVTIKDALSQPVQGAVVELYNGSGAFQGSQTTDPAGEALFSISPTTLERWHIRAYKIEAGKLLSPVSSFLLRQTLNAGPSGASIELIAPLGTPAPSDPALCLVLFSGQAADWQSLDSPPLVLGTPQKPRQEALDQIELPRGGLYLVTLPAVFYEAKKVRIPDVSSIELADLLWPYTLSLTFDNSAVTMSVGQEVEVSFSFSLSTRTDLDPDDQEWNFWEFSSLKALSGEVEVMQAGSNKALLRGLSAGSTQVVAENRSDIRLPTPPITHTPLQVTVV